MPNAPNRPCACCTMPLVRGPTAIRRLRRSENEWTDDCARTMKNSGPAFIGAAMARSIGRSNGRSPFLARPIQFEAMKPNSISPPCRRWAFSVLAPGLPPQGAWAQQASGASLNDQELLGMRLFNQSCRVCHTKPQMTSTLYGPELSQNSLGGQEAVMREVISNGTPRMPGFKYHFEPAQIEAIVAYLKTIPTPGAPASPAR